MVRSEAYAKSFFAWADPDYLVIASPPGTGDETLTVSQTIPDIKALIVTTPQELLIAKEFNIMVDEIAGVNIPTGLPLVYELKDDLKTKGHFCLGQEKRLEYR